jgi:hypothetical protein
MTTKDIEVIPVEQPSPEALSYGNAKIKTNFISNAHHSEGHSVDRNNLPITRKSRRASNILIGFHVPTTRKIRIAMYTVCFLFLL